MKRLMLIIMVLIIAVAVMGCEKTDKMAYKSVNGETIYNVGEYGAKRIIEVEAFEYETQYVIAEIPCLLKNTLLFVITFWCPDEIYEEGESAVAVYTYMYSWNNRGVVDDTWNEEIIIYEW